MKFNENTREWVRALRSRRYDQGINQLAVVDEDAEDADGTLVRPCTDRDKFCCLGVAPQHFGKWEDWGYSYYDSMYDVMDSDPFEFLGIVHRWRVHHVSLGAVGANQHKWEASLDEQDMLAALNDGGYTFDQIADILEAGETDEAAIVDAWLKREQKKGGNTVVGYNNVPLVVTELMDDER